MHLNSFLNVSGCESIICRLDSFHFANLTLQWTTKFRGFLIKFELLEICQRQSLLSGPQDLWRDRHTDFLNLFTNIHCVYHYWIMLDCREVCTSPAQIIVTSSLLRSSMGILMTGFGRKSKYITTHASCESSEVEQEVSVNCFTQPHILR